MRIAYLSLHWPRTTNSGVGKKMLLQMKIWKEEGHEVRFFSHLHPYPHPEELLPGENEVFNEYGGGLGKAWTELSRIRAMQSLLKRVAVYRPDLIYLRSAIYVYPLHRLFSIAPVVMEINTNEVAQHRKLGQVYHWYNVVTRNLLLRRASGLVCVAREIAASADLARFRAPKCAIGNGFDVDAVDPLPAPGNAVPRLVLIGSPGNPWHGADKLVELARRCPDLAIDVIGYDEIEGAGPLPPNMALYGYLDTADYLDILGRAEAGLGSLALHRIEVYEGSPLKTREYLAYGLPLVLPYQDTDLDGLEAGWLLKIPNAEDNVHTHADAIHDFAYRMRGQRADRSQVRQRLNARGKELERLDFFMKVKGLAKK